MGRATNKEKDIWNEAVKATLSEMTRYDVIIPLEADRKYLTEQITGRVAYKMDDDGVRWNTKGMHECFRESMDRIVEVLYGTGGFTMDEATETSEDILRSLDEAKMKIVK